jgi:threonine synthase
MSKFLFQCIDCKKDFVPGEVRYVCPECKAGQMPMQPLLGILRCTYDYDKLRKVFTRASLKRSKRKGFARYLDLLPIKSAGSLPPLIVGPSPLRAAANIAYDLSIGELWLKDDTCMPTGSFKDRASALVVACAHEDGMETIATASTGNAATALAGQAASVGMKCVIFVPESAPKAKLAQIQIYGARLLPIKGSYDQAFDLSIEACERFGWYNRNTAYNPFTIEGKKTAALEIWEQMNGNVPDWVFMPTGDGVILSGIDKGFSDLREMGLIDKAPRLVAVQASGASPIVKAIEAGAEEIIPERSPHTIADSISVGVPRAGRWAIDALRRCNGLAVAVSDEEIVNSIAYLGRSVGMFAEPAAATAFAGVRKCAARGVIGASDRVVALITGNGLKDVPAAMRSLPHVDSIEPTIDAVGKAISSNLA